MDFKSLPSQQTLCESIDRVTHQGMDILRLNHPLFEAAVSLHGAHLLWYKPTSQQHDVIWLSQAAEFAEDKAIRGGVPVCWPWFGKLAAPSHGFARTSLWQLVEFRHSDDKVELVLGLESSEATQAIWPHQFKLRLHFQFSDTLKIHLNIENTDKAQWLFSGALHTYFNVGDIDHVLITGMGDTYSDNLQQNKICQGRKLLGFNREVDRVYTQAEPCIRIHDRLNRRTILVENQNENAAVIWNPWKELSHSMADMKDDSYQTMVCVEAAVHALSLEQGYKLAPGEHYQLSTCISVLNH